KWHYLGPFDNTDRDGFDSVYPPERDVDLKKTCVGKNGQKIQWQEFAKFRVGRVNNLALFSQNDFACIYLVHEFESPKPLSLPISLGSDDTLSVWLNGKRLLAQNVERPAAPDQDRLTLEAKPGKNQLLVKVCNAVGEWGFYLRPEFPPTVEVELVNRLNRDF